MNKIMAELNSKFSGQSAARLDTYAGKMDLLKVSAENAKEEIGKGILDALSLLGKDNNIQTATDLMDGFGRATADVIVGIGVLASKLEKLGSTKVGGALFNVKNIPVLGAYIAGFQELGASERAKTRPDAGGAARTASRIYLDQLRRETKILKDLAKQRAAELAALKAKSEVDKLKDKFDLERIGLTKALNDETNEEIKKRIEAKIAILDNNEALAKKINAEMDAAKKAKELADTFGGAANALTAQIAKMSAMNDSLINKINAKIAAGAYVPPSAFNIPGVGSAFPTPSGPLGGVDYTVPMGSGNPVYAPGVSGTPMSYADVRLVVDTSVTGDKFQQLIAESIQGAQRSGYSTSAAGSLP
jgi:hypothetical protein